MLYPHVAEVGATKGRETDPSHFFHKHANQFMRVLLSCLNHLLIVPPLNTITLAVKFQYISLGRHVRPQHLVRNEFIIFNYCNKIIFHYILPSFISALVMRGGRCILQRRNRSSTQVTPQMDINFETGKDANRSQKNN